MAQNFMSLLSPLLATRATLGTGAGYKTQLALIATVGPNSHALSMVRPILGGTDGPPVLGVIILALSLAFFYLYLARVYPITEIF